MAGVTLTLGHDGAPRNADGVAGGVGRTVRPLSGWPESVSLLLITVAVLSGLAGYLLLRPEKLAPPVPLSWQVRSFDGLGPVDQAIHGALLPAGEEIIWNNNDTGGWITLERAQQLLLPPFYLDGFWRTNGRVQWQLVLPGTHQVHAPSVGVGSGNHEEDHSSVPGLEGEAARAPAASAPPATNQVSAATQGQGATVYYGSAGQASGQGAYLLVIGHAHAGVMWANQATIWIHRDPNAPYPGVVKPEALISQGWRQIIPYNGAREVERVKGTP